MAESEGMAEESLFAPLGPLFDVGVEFVATSSDFLDAYKKHPAVELAKVTLAVLGLRLDLLKSEASSSSSTVPRFAHSHPFVTWLSSFCTAYAGGIVAAFLTGDSVLTPFANPDSLLFATIAFLVVFYSPFDLFARLFRWKPFHLLLAVASEIYRVGNIFGGVKLGASLPASASAFPATLMITLGVAKGAGSSLLLPVIRLLRTGGSAGGYSLSNEILEPTLFLKATFWASLVVTAFRLELLPVGVTFPALHLFLHVFFVGLRLASSMAADAKRLDLFKAPEMILGAGLRGISVQWLSSQPGEEVKDGGGGGGGGGGGVPAAPDNLDKAKTKTTPTKRKSKKDD